MTNVGGNRYINLGCCMQSNTETRVSIQVLLSSAELPPHPCSHHTTPRPRGFVVGWVQPDGEDEGLVPLQIHSPCHWKQADSIANNLILAIEYIHFLLSVRKSRPHGKLVPVSVNGGCKADRILDKQEQVRMGYWWQTCCSATQHTETGILPVSVCQLKS